MLAAALAIVALNAFFVIAEFAVVRVRPTRMMQLAQEGNRRAAQVARALEHLDAHISACQVGVTLTSLGLGWIGEPAVERLITALLARASHAVSLPAIEVIVRPLAFLIAFSLLTGAHIVLGELVPKTLSIARAEDLALRIIGPFQLFARLFRVPIRLLNLTANGVVRLLGEHAEPDEPAGHTDEELRMLVHSSAQSGYLDETERDLLDSVFDFSDRIVRQAMTPRQDMVVLYVEDPIEESLETARREGYTRFPLCAEEKDNILGVVHIKDLFARAGEITDLREIVRPVLEVPETLPLRDALREMQRRRLQLAVVRDEYGGTAGIITMEDIIEELVGDIADEFDPVTEPEVAELGQGVYDVDGALVLDDVQRRIGIRLPGELGVDTIGGYVLALLGRQPVVGDRVDLGACIAEVTQVEGFRISRLRLMQKPSHPASTPLVEHAS